METQDLLIVALHAFPELNARGFFTVIEGVEHYFSALQEMKVETTYRSFYDEYDLAFSLRCVYSICDRKTESRWIRMDGDRHVYRTPLLYVINRFDMDGSPMQIADKMSAHYRANTLVLEKYTHPEYSVTSLQRYLHAQGIYFMMRADELKEKAGGENENINAAKVKQEYSNSFLHTELVNNKNCKELQSLF